MKRRFWVSALAAILTGCSAKTLPLNVHQLSTREAIAQSSKVVVGVVKSIGTSGESQRTAEGVWVRARRVEVKPMCVLKGTIEGKTFTFLFNNYDSRVGVQNGDFEWLQPGDRRVFFLESQSSTLRSVSDLYKTSLVFPHAVLPAVGENEQEPTGDRIATLLLRKAPGESAEDFAKMLPRATTEALRCGGYLFVASLLGQLEAGELPEVRTEACLTAYEQVFGGEACVIQVEAGTVIPEVSQRVLKARERRAYLRRVAAQALREGWDCPLLSYTYGVEPQDPVSVAGFLEYMSQQPDPVFRASAEKQLHNLSAPIAK
jgi:hypothetical protein